MAIIIHIDTLRVSALAFYPFIFIRKKSYRKDKVLMQHERIHIRQQIELLFIPFYIIYIANWLINRIRYKDADLAYKNIIFEREAFACEKTKKYLDSRPIWAFLKY